MSIWRRILLWSLALLLGVLSCFSASAEDMSKGEKMFENARAQWMQFCINLTTGEYADIKHHLELSAHQLESEGNNTKLAECLVLLADVYSYSYLTILRSSTLCDWVIRLDPDKTSRNNIMAKCLKAVNKLWEEPGIAEEILSSIPLECIDYVTTADAIRLIHTQASVRYWTGDLSLAGGLYNLLLKFDVDELADYDLVQYINALADYAYFLFMRGQMLEGNDMLNKCNEIVKKRGLRSSEVYITLFRTQGAFHSRLKKVDTAVELYEITASLYMNNYGSDCVGFIDAVRAYTEALASSGDFEGAESMIKTAVDVAESLLGVNSLAVSNLEASYGHILFLQRKYLEAGERYKKVVAISDVLNLHDVQGYANLITCMRLSSQQEDAMSVAAEAVRKERDYLRRVFLSLSEKGRESYWTSNAYNLIRLLTLAVATPKEKNGTLYDIALLSNGLLMESSSQFLNMVKESDDKELLILWQRYQACQIELESTSTAPGEGSKREELRAEMVAIESELMLRAQSFSYYLSGFNTVWTDVSNALGENEVAIEFIRYKDWESNKNKYIASAITHGAPPVNVPLPRIDEESLIKMSNFDKYSTGFVYKAVFAPLESILKGKKTVYFATSGILNSIALECLKTPRGKVLCDVYDLHRLSSTRQIVGRTEKGRWTSAALFGGCDYNLGLDEMEYYAETASGRSLRGGGLHDWTYLPGTLDEVQQLYAALPMNDKILVAGESAVEESFKALNGQGISLIHIATHGYYDKRATESVTEGVPDEDLAMSASGLVFSGANNIVKPHENVDDGLLAASEIAKMNLVGCDLVVLSACGTGLGLIDSSNESYGLMRAFKKAGCRSLLMSLWEIDDEASLLFMTKFYDALNSGKSTSEAMTHAREQVRSFYPDPLYWAPFVLID